MTIEQIGQQLRQARETQKLSIEQASNHTHIRARYLQALEEGELGVLPSAVQVRGFLRSYAEFLGLDSKALLAELLRPEGEQEEPTEVEPLPEDFAEEDISGASQAEIQDVEAIFTEIGTALRQRREVLGLSLDDIEQHTRIAANYAQMLEDGQFTRFPSPVQARGMLTNYVDFLKMDANAVLLRYAEALQARLANLQAQEAPPKSAREKPSRFSLPFQIPPWLRQFVSVDTIVFGAAGLLVVALMIWGIGRVLTVQTAIVPTPTGPSLPSVLNPAATDQPTPTSPQLITPTPEFLDVDEPDQTLEITPTIRPAGPSEIQIFIIIHQRAYLKVIVDGVVAFEGRTIPGANLPYSGQQRIEILTGNAAAIQVFYNGQDLGTLGIFGEVINMTYTRDGVATPTATISPTPDEENLPTATPTYTPPPE